MRSCVPPETAVGPARPTATPAAQKEPQSGMRRSQRRSNAGALNSSKSVSSPGLLEMPFSIDSVRTKAPRHPPRGRPRLFGLAECPTFYPSLEEFKDPMAYIDSIAEEGKEYGMCKIVPPEGWQMPFRTDTETFRFKTRVQKLNQLEAASRAKMNFLEQISMFHMQQGNSKLHIPLIDRRPLDLWKLRREVNRRGGYLELDRIKGWPKIVELLGHKVAWTPHVRMAFMDIVLPFDNWLVHAKASTTATMPDHTAGSSHGPTPSPTKRKIRTTAGPSIDDKASVPGFEKDDTASELSEEDYATSMSSMTSLSSVSAFEKSSPQKAYQEGENCEICKDGHANKMLLCDGCDRGFHTFCLDPPLSAVPTSEEWFCNSCLLSQGEDFGFEEGDTHSVSSFQIRDEKFSNSWWSRHRPYRDPSQHPSPTKRSVLMTHPPDGIPPRRLGKAWISEDDVEREFWRLTDSSETAEVEYGADIHTTIHGSAGPTLQTHLHDPYSTDPWNLNNIPILPDSLLRYIKSDISGMTVPWIYIGMMFSAFCWHNEDHYTYSVNYMFWGETKTWYSVPGSDAEKFETAMKSEAPDLFEQQPGLLFQLITLMNPGQLVDAGVKVVACDQRPNEFVVTFPKAYHCGFNHGINMNEAVNFALPDWLPEGKASVQRYKEHLKPPVFSHNELLVAIKVQSDIKKTAIWLEDAFLAMVEQEISKRESLRISCPDLAEILVERDCPEEQYQCVVCKGFCYLAQVTCSCTTCVACLDHGEQLCLCGSTKKTLRKRFSDAQLQSMGEFVMQHAMLPTRPSSKPMRTLIASNKDTGDCSSDLDPLRKLVKIASVLMDIITTMTNRRIACMRTAKINTSRRSRGKAVPIPHVAGPASDSLDILSDLIGYSDLLTFETFELPRLQKLMVLIENLRQGAAFLLKASGHEGEKALEVYTSALPTLQIIFQRLEWLIKAEKDDGPVEYLEVLSLLNESTKCQISPEHPAVKELRQRECKGKRWYDMAEMLLKSRSIRIEDVAALVKQDDIPPAPLYRELQGLYETASSWQASAKVLLSTAGPSVSAEKLSQTVAAASGPLSRVEIPEINQLRAELGKISSWNEAISKMLGVPKSRLADTINYVRATFEERMAPDDDLPNAKRMCICRSKTSIKAAAVVTCRVCKHAYHLACVEQALREPADELTCPLCQHIPAVQGPSLDAFMQLIAPQRWAFSIISPEIQSARHIGVVAIRYAPQLIQLVDTVIDAQSQLGPETIRHALRKVYSLPLVFDAYNLERDKRCVFSDWLFRMLPKAIHERYEPHGTDVAKAHAGALGASHCHVDDRRSTCKKRSINHMEESELSVRRDKGHFVLAQSQPQSFRCVCLMPPPETSASVSGAVECPECGQVYHRNCIKASPEPKGTDWRCPCCAVNAGDSYQNADVRVQFKSQIGTDKFIDYRATMNGCTKNPIIITLPPSTNVIALECTEYLPSLVANEVEVSSGRELRDDEKRQRLALLEGEEH